MNINKVASSYVVALALFCAASMSFGSVYVDANSEAASPDGSESAPFKTIQEGVNAATTDGEVLVAPGEYPLGATLSVAKRIHIHATGENPRDTVIYAVNGDIRCLTMSSGALFSGFTVSNGFDTVQGGGAKLTGSSCISNCIVTCCRVESDSADVLGGGVYAAGKDSGGSSGAMVVDCVIDGCRAIQNATGSFHAYGGGIYNKGWSEVVRTTIRNCHVLASNSTSAKAYGGGLHAAGSYGTAAAFAAEGCLFADCTASNLVSAAKGVGGGACYDLTFLSDTNNRLVDSTASCCAASGDGGGVYGTSGGTTSKILTLQGSTFRGNVAGSNGGGVRCPSSQINKVFVDGCVIENNCAENGGGANIVGLVLSNSVVRANMATALGGGVHCGGEMYIGKCLFSGNAAGNIGGALYNNGVRMAVIADSTFSENTAIGDGAAVFAHQQYALKDARLDVRNLQVDGNVGKSALIFAPSKDGTADILLDACTIVGNVCTNTAVSLEYFDWAYRADRMFVCNTLFSGNTSTATPDAPDLIATMSSQWQNVTYSFLPTGAAAFENEDCHNVVGVADPLFADAENGDYRLKSKSPCVDVGFVDDWMYNATDHGTGEVIETPVGTYGVTLAFDKARPRVVDGNANIGCFGTALDSGMTIVVR